MGDLFGGPFFHAPVPPACGGTMGERHDGAYDSGGSPLWQLALPPCPVGSVSLDSRTLGLPYESSSFATPRSSVGRQKESASEFLVSP